MRRLRQGHRMMATASPAPLVVWPITGQSPIMTLLLHALQLPEALVTHLRIIVPPKGVPRIEWSQITLGDTGKATRNKRGRLITQSFKRAALSPARFLSALREVFELPAHVIAVTIDVRGDAIAISRCQYEPEGRRTADLAQLQALVWLEDVELAGLL
jgi:hypothetical protein